MDTMKYRAIGVALGLIFSAALAFQLCQVYRFVNSGPRFTAFDGEKLCQRVRRLELVSYGFIDSKTSSEDCHYNSR